MDVRGEDIAAVPDHRQDGDGTMTTAMPMPGNTASTFLIHLFGGGLEDDRYVVEKFTAMADGDLRPVRPEAPKSKGRGKAKRVTATLKEVGEMQPARTEIIVCTGLRTRGGQPILGFGGRGPVPRPQAEGLSGVLRGRPAGTAPAGRPSSGFHFWLGGRRTWLAKTLRSAACATASVSASAPPNAPPRGSASEIRASADPAPARGGFPRRPLAGRPRAAPAARSGRQCR